MIIPTCNDDLVAEIAAAAKAASPGPHHIYTNQRDDNNWHANADFHAKCMPQVVLALTAEIEELKTWKAEMLQVMSPVMDYAHSLKIAKLGGSVTKALIDDHAKQSALVAELEIQVEAQRFLLEECRETMVEAKTLYVLLDAYLKGIAAAGEIIQVKRSLAAMQDKPQ